MSAERTDRYPSMDIREANNECGVKPHKQKRAVCPKCAKSIFLHCDDCKIQVTGCICTEVDRFGNSEALERMIERVGEEQAVREMQKAGLWVPPGALN